jgi:hypothetical protein
MTEMDEQQQFEDKILTKKKFAKLVEEKVIATKMNYIDAVISVCDDRELDPRDVGKLISPIIKDKIEAEAIALNMIKGGNQLPI